MIDLALRVFGILAFLTVFVALLLPAPATATPQRVCRPARVEAAIVWRGERDGVPYPGARVWRALNALRGPTFWRSVGNYGVFDWPEGWHIESKFYLLPSRGQAWFIVHPSQPERVYFLLFPNDATYAMADGSHYGIHPCYVAVVSRSAADGVYATMGR